MAFGNPFRNRTIALEQRPKRVFVLSAPRELRKRSTVEGARHLAMLKTLPCACCEVAGPSDAHHIREGQGGAQRAPDWLAVPLCKACHQGPQGIHGDRSRLALRKLTELDMLAATIRALMRDTDSDSIPIR